VVWITDGKWIGQYRRQYGTVPSAMLLGLYFMFTLLLTVTSRVAYLFNKHKWAKCGEGIEVYLECLWGQWYAYRLGRNKVLINWTKCSALIWPSWPGYQVWTSYLVCIHVVMKTVSKQRNSSAVVKTFETWWHTRRNQIWSFREMDESILIGGGVSSVYCWQPMSADQRTAIV